MPEEYNKATPRRPRIGRILGILSRRNRLKTLAEAKEGQTCAGQAYGGLRYVPVSEIKGTVQRPFDFDENFRPTQNHTKFRWESVNRAFEQGVYLPPVRLFKYRGTYFVSDGHHRVSVTRYRGGQWVDAEVTELFSSPSPDSN